MEWLWSTRLYNFFRRLFAETPNEPEQIIGISEECNHGWPLCQHQVQYRYNGLIQTETLDSATVLKWWSNVYPDREPPPHAFRA